MDKDLFPADGTHYPDGSALIRTPEGGLILQEAQIAFQLSLPASAPAAPSADPAPLPKDPANLSGPTLGGTDC
jgi:hypothetical protein